MNHHTVTHPPVPGPPPARISSAIQPAEQAARPHPSAKVDPADDHRTFLWRVDTLDLFGRERVIHAGLRGKHMVMIVPAGESATLTAGQARQLAHALNAGADQLDQQAGRPLSTGAVPMVPATSGGEAGFSTRAGRHEIGRQLPGHPIPREPAPSRRPVDEDEEHCGGHGTD